MVLNQFRDGTGVSGREVAEALGTKIFATLEWDGESVVQSLNLGQPAVRGRSRFAQAMSKMGKRLAGSAGDEEAKSGILPFIQSLRQKRSGK